MIFTILRGCLPYSNDWNILKCECTYDTYGSYYDPNQTKPLFFFETIKPWLNGSVWFEPKLGPLLPVDTIGRTKSRPTKRQCARWLDALLLVELGKRIWLRKQRSIQTRPTWSVDPRAQLHYWQDTKKTPREFGRRGSHSTRPSRQNNPIECGYCEKFGHYEEECRKKKRESVSTSRQLRNYATNSDYDDQGGMFVMSHKAHSMKSSNPIAPLLETMYGLLTLEHPITWRLMKIGSKIWEILIDLAMSKPGMSQLTSFSMSDIPFGNDSKQTYLKNVLHVSTITKNLVSVGQIVEQDMQVQFKHEGCFMEKHDRLVARGRREGQMFILDLNEIKSAMFAKVLKVDIDLEVWHKRINYINL